MNTNRKILAQKSDQDLEKYLVPDNRYEPDANRYAYEILQARGRQFSVEERETIEGMIAAKEEKEKIVVHPYHRKAANLLYTSGGIGLINLFILQSSFTTETEWASAIISLLILFAIAVFASKGSSNVKYVLLVLLILGIIPYLNFLSMIVESPYFFFSNLVQSALQVWAAILLFKIPKKEILLRQG